MPLVVFYVLCALCGCQDDSEPPGEPVAPGTASLDEVRDLVSKTLEAKGVLGSIKVCLPWQN